MNRTTGTVIRGVRTPVIREGDDLVGIVAEAVAACHESEGFAYRDMDVVGVTEAVVARAQGNYASIDAIGDDVYDKFISGKAFANVKADAEGFAGEAGANADRADGENETGADGGGADGGGADGDPVDEANYGADAFAPGRTDTDRLDELAVVFPIFSRNRFSICLKGIALAARKIRLVLNYPADEVGNYLFDESLIYEKDVNPWYDALSLEQYCELFGRRVHAVTGVDYAAYYKEIIEESGAECEITFCNNLQDIAGMCDDILLCSIHGREQLRELLLAYGAENVLLLSDIMTSKRPDSNGYNNLYGLLGSNLASDGIVKLFPRDCEEFVEALGAKLAALTGKNIEVLIYGDGAYKDPVHKIWELADPVVSPAFSKGLAGMTNEMKLKYLADNEFAALTGEELTRAVREKIGAKRGDVRKSMIAQGTTPRRVADLLGSLCDLASGSGDKGTPVVYIQGYFDNYSA